MSRIDSDWATPVWVKHRLTALDADRIYRREYMADWSGLINASDPPKMMSAEELAESFQKMLDCDRVVSLEPWQRRPRRGEPMARPDAEWFDATP